MRSALLTLTLLVTAPFAFALTLHLLGVHGPKSPPSAPQWYESRAQGMMDRSEAEAVRAAEDQ